MVLYVRALLILVVSLFGVSLSHAQADALKVGVRAAPPFSFQDETGAWTGIAVELWEQIAEANGVAFDYQAYDLSTLLNQLSAGEIDVAVGALTVTAEREKQFDFTHPFVESGLAIAAEQKPAGLWHSVKRFVSLQFLQALIALGAVLFAFGFLIWWFERKQNDQFGGSTLEGVGSGFWWSAVTMTTVGYGDKSPVTLGGRVVGLVWMFAAIIIISGFTAAIASSLTVGSLQTSIQGMDDLYDAKVGVIRSSSAADFLANAQVDYRDYSTLNEVLDALQKGKLDAVVHDAPILEYQLSQRDMSDFRLLPEVMDPQNYAIGLVSGSEYREGFNQALLEITHSDAWVSLNKRYMQAD